MTARIEFSDEDIKKIEDLAAIHCTMKEIAFVMGCSINTLDRNYMPYIERGRERGKASLRRMQWEAATTGNITMLIWLGKQMLEQREVVHTVDDRHIQIDLRQVFQDEKSKSAIKELSKRLIAVEDS